MHNSRLDTPIQYLKSVGPKRAEAFNAIGIKTIHDLLHYFPTRHLDRSNIVDSQTIFNTLTQNSTQQFTIIAKVASIQKRKISGNREILAVKFSDSKGYIEGVWFQGVKYFSRTFHEGDFFAVSGKPIFKLDCVQFFHPDCEKITEDENKLIHTGKLIPVYSLREGLKKTNINLYTLRTLIKKSIDFFINDVTETLPDDIINNNSLISLKSAIKHYHFPDNFEQLNKAKYRFKFEEIFYFNLMMAVRKSGFKNHNIGYPMNYRNKLVTDFINSLPFNLTDGQIKVLKEIFGDLENSKPMNRLLQGDVGSGKTLVALLAMLVAKDNGYQSAIMVPTELLANQHFKNLQKLLSEFDVRCTLLIGSQKKKEREAVLESIISGESDIVIGTHALIEQAIEFKNLGLVVIDEQHRFGVDQRAKFIKKGFAPHTLVMSATPIPRTLAMTAYGDLDVSIIDVMPLNRKPIKTYLRSEDSLPDIYKFVIDKRKEGYQTYIIAPLVDESDKMALNSAIQSHNELSQTYLKELKLGLVHGKMKWSEKDEMMLSFAQKEYDVLVSTTVIEVGIDIPDANIIIILDAHRFGLAQLHQLRGRVGRSNKQAYCILITTPNIFRKAKTRNPNDKFDIDSSLDDENLSAARLQTMVSTTNGFTLSEYDLKLRGPGDIFGTQQTGLPALKFINVVEDIEIIQKTRNMTSLIISSDEKLKNNEFLRNQLSKHFSKRLIYSDIG